MALVTIASDASVDASTAQFAPQLSGDLIAGENLLACAPCYIKAADGLVYMCNATTAGVEAARLAGFAPRAVVAGQPCTLYGVGTRFDFDLTGGWCGAVDGRVVGYA